MPTLNSYADGFIRSLVYGMAPYLSLPKEILIIENEPCPKLFLVVKGRVHVLTMASTSLGTGRSPKAKEANGKVSARKASLSFKENLKKFTGGGSKVKDSGKVHDFVIEATLGDGAILGDFKPNNHTYRSCEYGDMYTLDLTHYSDCFSFVNNNRSASKRDLIKEDNARTGYLASDDDANAKKGAANTLKKVGSQIVRGASFFNPSRRKTNNKIVGV